MSNKPRMTPERLEWCRTYKQGYDEYQDEIEASWQEIAELKAELAEYRAMEERECDYCGGGGIVVKTVCPVCNGWGVVWAKPERKDDGG